MKFEWFIWYPILSDIRSLQLSTQDLFSYLFNYFIYVIYAFVTYPFWMKKIVNVQNDHRNERNVKEDNRWTSYIFSTTKGYCVRYKQILFKDVSKNTCI